MNELNAPSRDSHTNNLAGLFPLTLYKIIKVTETEGSKQERAETGLRTFRVHGESEFLFNFFLRVNEKGSDSCHSSGVLEDRSGARHLVVSTPNGFPKAECVCAGCKYFRQQNKTPQPTETMTVSASSNEIICHINLTHDGICAIDPVRAVAICSTPAAPHAAICRVSYPEHGQRRPIGLLKREENDESVGEIGGGCAIAAPNNLKVGSRCGGFTIEPQESTSVKEMAILFAIGTAAFALEWNRPSPLRFAPGTMNHEKLPRSTRRPHNDDKCDRFCRCCCCDTRGEQHNMCYAATDLCIRCICMSGC